MANFQRKSTFLGSEVVRYKTYIDSLAQARDINATQKLVDKDKPRITLESAYMTAEDEKHSLEASNT